MVWYPAYLDSKQDIVDWISQQIPNATTGLIPDINLRMTDVQIFGTLETNGITVSYTGTVSGNTVSPSDINSYLWAASLAYNLEMLATRGTIHYTHGGIAQTKIGQLTTQFMRMQPMFFIPRGSEGLDKMMPFRSYKQMAQTYVQNYIKAWNLKDSGRIIASPQIDFDRTARGYAWNAQSGYMRDADAASSGLV